MGNTNPTKNLGLIFKEVYRMEMIRNNRIAFSTPIVKSHVKGDHSRTQTDSTVVIPYTFSLV
jgi:hypothetical protein